VLLARQYLRTTNKEARIDASAQPITPSTRTVPIERPPAPPGIPQNRHRPSGLPRDDPRCCYFPARSSYCIARPPRMCCRRRHQAYRGARKPSGALNYRAPAIFAQWSASLIKPFFTLVRHHACQSVVGPASPAASPEFRVLSHGCVASRGVLKGAPRSIRVPRECRIVVGDCVAEMAKIAASPSIWSSQIPLTICSFRATSSA